MFPQRRMKTENANRPVSQAQRPEQRSPEHKRKPAPLQQALRVVQSMVSVKGPCYLSSVFLRPFNSTAIPENQYLFFLVVSESLDLIR